VAVNAPVDAVELVGTLPRCSGNTPERRGSLPMSRFPPRGCGLAGRNSVMSRFAFPVSGLGPARPTYDLPPHSGGGCKGPEWIFKGATAMKPWKTSSATKEPRNVCPYFAFGKTTCRTASPIAPFVDFSDLPLTISDISDVPLLVFKGALLALEAFRNEVVGVSPETRIRMVYVTLKLIASKRVGDRPNRVELRAIKRRPKPHRLLKDHADRDGNACWRIDSVNSAPFRSDPNGGTNG